MMNGPVAGGSVGPMSGTSWPTQLFVPSFHHRYFFFSLQGFPEASAEARL